MPNEVIREKIMELVSRDQIYYGYRKITVYLRRECSLRIGSKEFYRICKSLGILSQRHLKFKNKRSFKRAFDRNITQPHQMYQVDDVVAVLRKAVEDYKDLGADLPDSYYSYRQRKRVHQPLICSCV